MGPSEGAEQQRMVTNLEGWLNKIVALHGLSTFFPLDKERWVLAPVLLLGASTCPVVAKLLHFGDRDTILCISRQTGHYEMLEGDMECWGCHDMYKIPLSCIVCGERLRQWSRADLFPVFSGVKKAELIYMQSVKVSVNE
ncbi:hypothetical protein NDU88_008094 [Pleurodeles waltl]|uniref:Uncharacterized protein n=1 Tax=Pleurodeles waltl TaxID=8319 RepID=A0AAV7RTR5_PLEWA|nr:hypothetical protein NDU88_008093 [Pleurodeles waltl]KAJ1155364.1 hypothetical protein NDU88_008094 [Pleurodeles waltl]